jgi:hypothetical protein
MEEQQPLFRFQMTKMHVKFWPQKGLYQNSYDDTDIRSNFENQSNIAGLVGANSRRVYVPTEGYLASQSALQLIMFIHCR